MINEALAKRAKENVSFSDYKQGSATAGYNAEIAEIKRQIDEAKSKVSPEAQERLEKLFEWYKNAYATWINKHNANGANHVSVMISGPSNYNMRHHEKYLARENKLWAEYEELDNISHKIHAIVTGDKIIKSDDDDAIEKLKEKLEKALAEHQGYKDYNITARKEKKETLPAYVIANSNGRIKAIRDRLVHLEELAVRAKATPQTETEINGVRIVDNLEAQRVQMFFDGKPSAETREELKTNGFRWTPSIGAWQSYRNYGAIQKAEKIAKMY